MEIGASPLFRGISEESQQAMRTCFDMREVSFRADEVVYDFGAGRNMVGVLAEGAAVIERIDQQGNRTILERLESGGVFGEMLMFENVTGDSITVVAETACRVWFMAADQVTKRCEKACAHHTQVVENMFQLVEDICKDDNLEELAKQVDVIFTATPQGFLAGLLTEEILSQVKIVDLSADYRIKDVATYEKWYGIEHKSPQFIEEAVYGLCEINRDKITEKTRLVANPGCYTTCSILTAYPMVKEGMIDVNTLIVDAKSGTSGAGRGAKVPNLFCEVNENMKAYGVASHRHTPEIEEQLGYAGNCQVTINFTPHLVPMNRGILATEYATLKRKPDGTLPTYEEVKAVYDKYYANEKFVRVLDKGSCPETKWVEGSNYVDINFVIDERTGRIIMMGALDNLVKGAAGQAVQNMNLLFGLPESEGLELVPCFP